MTEMIHAIQHHPAVAFVITAVHFVLGITLPFLMKVMEAHIPPIVIETLQCGAFVIGMCAGAITVYSFIEKKRNERKRK